MILGIGRGNKNPIRAEQTNQPDEVIVKGRKYRIQMMDDKGQAIGGTRLEGSLARIGSTGIAVLNDFLKRTKGKLPTAMQKGKPQTFKYADLTPNLWPHRADLPHKMSGIRLVPVKDSYKEEIAPTMLRNFFSKLSKQKAEKKLKSQGSAWLLRTGQKGDLVLSVRDQNKQSHHIHLERSKSRPGEYAFTLYGERHYISLSKNNGASLSQKMLNVFQCDPINSSTVGSLLPPAFQEKYVPSWHSKSRVKMNNGDWFVRPSGTKQNGVIITYKIKGKRESVYLVRNQSDEDISWRMERLNGDPINLDIPSIENGRILSKNLFQAVRDTIQTFNDQSNLPLQGPDTNVRAGYLGEGLRVGESAAEQALSKQGNPRAYTWQENEGGALLSIRYQNKIQHYQIDSDGKGRYKVHDPAMHRWLFGTEAQNTTYTLAEIQAELHRSDMGYRMITVPTQEGE